MQIGLTIFPTDDKCSLRVFRNLTRFGPRPEAKVKCLKADHPESWPNLNAASRYLVLIDR
jgi:hypothetical protein